MLYPKLARPGWSLLDDDKCGDLRKPLLSAITGRSTRQKHGRTEEALLER